MSVLAACLFLQNGVGWVRHVEICEVKGVKYSIACGFHMSTMSLYYHWWKQVRCQLRCVFLDNFIVVDDPHDKIQEHGWIDIWYNNLVAPNTTEGLSTPKFFSAKEMRYAGLLLQCICKDCRQEPRQKTATPCSARAPAGEVFPGCSSVVYSCLQKWSLNSLEVYIC